MRRLVGYGLVAIIVAGLSIGYVRVIGPAARADRLSSCAARGATPVTDGLGRLPQPAPELKVQDYTGKLVSLADYRGRAVFLNFWAPWCPPCLDEMPAMDKLARSVTNEPISVLAVGEGTSWEQVGEALRKLLPAGTAMTLLADTMAGEGQVGDLARRFGTEKLPETYLVDKNGVVRYYFVNKRDWTDPRAAECLRSLADE